MFEVAEALGVWDIRELLNNMTMDLFVYWYMYLQRKKLKHNKQDYQLAMLVKAVCEKDTKTNRPLKDYLIEFKTEEQLRAEQEAADLAMMDRLAALPGAIVEEINE